MIDAPLAYAFGAGMITAVNPCGFAMLPAYLGFFLGSDGGKQDGEATVRRSLTVSLSVSLGFLVVFSAVGLATYHLSASVERYTPWATMVIGAGIVVLGVAMLRGFEPVVRLPKLQKGGRTRDSRSMFLFGLSYAITSIGCAFPVFTVAVIGTFRQGNLLDQLAVFGAYAIGMTLVLVALTVSLGMARQGLLRSLRSALPHITRASGLLLVLAGSYLAYYGWHERRVYDGHLEGSTTVDTVTGWSDDIGRWIQDFGPTRLGLLLALGLLFVLIATFGFRTRDR